MPDAANIIRNAQDYQLAQTTLRRLYAALHQAAADRPPESILAPIHQRIDEVEAAIADYERRTDGE